VCLANRVRRSSGPVTTSALAWLIVWTRSERALRVATISARIASTAVAALRRAPGPAGLGGPGGADGIQRIGLALPATVLTAGTVDLDDPDAGRGDVAGQARAVATRTLDADQGDGPEPAPPAQQARVAARGSRELLHAQQPANRVQRGRDMHVGVGDRRRR